MSKRPPQNHKVDLVLLSIEMTQQAYHVKRCWHIIKQLQQAQIDYPEEINTSLGFYRTIFDSLVTSVLLASASFMTKTLILIPFMSYREL